MSKEKDTQLLKDAFNASDLQEHFVLQYFQSIDRYVFYTVSLLRIEELENKLLSLEWCCSNIIEIYSVYSLLLDDVFKKSLLQDYFRVKKLSYADKHKFLHLNDYVFFKVADKIAITHEP